MAINLRKFETVSEFSSAYTGGEYVEPWVSYIEETSGIVFNKVYLKRIEIKSLKMVGDVPASGGTVNKDNCTYTVNAVYNDMSRVDVTESAEVSGSLVVEASKIEHRHSAGTLTLTAKYSGLTGSADVKVYQEAFVPSVTAITLDNLTWAVDVPASGGTATKDNCTYTVTGYYDDLDGSTADITSAATVTGSLVVPESEITERHSAGTLTLTAEYSGLTNSDSVTVYQEEYPNYLKFNILSGGNIAFGAYPENKVKTATTLMIEYKKNDEDWTSITSQLPNTSSQPQTPEDVINAFSACSFSVNAGDVIMFRGNNQTYAFLNSDWFVDNFNAFFSTASFNVEGNIMSLVGGNDFKNLSQLTSAFTFYSLFSGCYKLVSAQNLLLPATGLTEGCYSRMFYNLFSYRFGLNTEMELTTAPSLPATTLAPYCYEGMFYGCTSLITAPALPATTLAESCYVDMFSDCTSLTTAPALPATTLASYCYSDMFNHCTSLATAPELPATTLAIACYYEMFGGCTRLTTAPELPATTLANQCYGYMFADCTSLTTAPDLPATTLETSCYQFMFAGCSNLNYIKCLATDISASYCTTSWVYNVAATGTFVKHSSTDWSSKTGTNGIPSNWTVQDAS